MELRPCSSKLVDTRQYAATRRFFFRGDIHRQRYADRRIVRFQRDPDAGVIVGFPNVRDTDNLKLHVVGNLFRMGLVPSSYIPSKDGCPISELLRFPLTNKNTFHASTRNQNMGRRNNTAAPHLYCTETIICCRCGTGRSRFEHGCSHYRDRTARRRCRW